MGQLFAENPLELANYAKNHVPMYDEHGMYKLFSFRMDLVLKSLSWVDIFQVLNYQLCITLCCLEEKE
mgnify:CR=1 FL=1